MGSSTVRPIRETPGAIESGPLMAAGSTRRHPTLTRTSLIDVQKLIRTEQRLTQPGQRAPFGAVGRLARGAEARGLGAQVLGAGARLGGGRRAGEREPEYQLHRFRARGEAGDAVGERRGLGGDE